MVLVNLIFLTHEFKSLIESIALNYCKLNITKQKKKKRIISKKEKKLSCNLINGIAIGMFVISLIFLGRDSSKRQVIGFESKYGAKY